MNLLIGNSAIQLDFSSREKSLITRAQIMIAYEEIGLTPYFNWINLCNKYPVIDKAYKKWVQPISK